jgi:hypothetical protein
MSRVQHYRRSPVEIGIDKPFDPSCFDIGRDGELGSIEISAQWSPTCEMAETNGTGKCRSMG